MYGVSKHGEELITCEEFNSCMLSWFHELIKHMMQGTFNVKIINSVQWQDGYRIISGKRRWNEQS